MMTFRTMVLRQSEHFNLTEDYGPKRQHPPLIHGLKLKNQLKLLKFFVLKTIELLWFVQSILFQRSAVTTINPELMIIIGLRSATEI